MREVTLKLKLSIEGDATDSDVILAVEQILAGETIGPTHSSDSSVIDDATAEVW